MSTASSPGASPANTRKYRERGDGILAASLCHWGPLTTLPSPLMPTGQTGDAAHLNWG